MRQVHVKTAVRKLAQSVLTSIPQVTDTHLNGVVKTVTAGASTDGRAQVVVTVNGTDTLAPYLDSYLTPAVNDLVRVQFKNGSPLILGRIVGLPSY